MPKKGDELYFGFLFSLLMNLEKNLFTACYIDSFQNCGILVVFPVWYDYIPLFTLPIPHWNYPFTVNS